MSDVIVLVCDENFAPHAKALMVNCRREGKWEGDFAVVTPSGTVARDFERHGVQAFICEQTGFFTKFGVFDPWMRKWDRAIYLDCDVVVQRPLAPLMDLLDTHPLWMDTEDGDTMRTFLRDPHPDQHKDTYDYIDREFPHVYAQTFNSAFIVYKPAEIPEGTVQQLCDIQAAILPVNRPQDGGTDQQVMNLLLWEKIRKIPNKLVCYWGLDNPGENRGPSESRGYVGGEIPVAVHYARAYPAWIPKNKYWNDGGVMREVAAYSNDRIDASKPLYLFYRENLAAFDSMFLVK